MAVQARPVVDRAVRSGAAAALSLVAAGTAVVLSGRPVSVRASVGVCVLGPDDHRVVGFAPGLPLRAREERGVLTS